MCTQIETPGLNSNPAMLRDTIIRPTSFYFTSDICLSDSLLHVRGQEKTARILDTQLWKKGILILSLGNTNLFSNGISEVTTGAFSNYDLNLTLNMAT